MFLISIFLMLSKPLKEYKILFKEFGKIICSTLVKFLKELFTLIMPSGNIIFFNSGKLLNIFEIFFIFELFPQTISSRLGKLSKE
ncbi:Uncharacterised protein [Chlamydia abortus]|nr:Uncharacterised protein [Chlamydia abortus]